MTGFEVLGIAVVVLLLASTGIAAVSAWYQYQIKQDVLAQRLYTDNRVELLTVQTLSAMRDAVRRAGGMS